MKRLVQWSCIFLFSVGAVGAQSAPQNPVSQVPASGTAASTDSIDLGGATPDEPAARFLGAMRTSFHSGIGYLAGLESNSDVDQAELGRPIKTFHVDLDRLQAYDGNSSVDGLFRELPMLTLLLRVKGQVRSIVEVVQDGGKWQLASVGNATRARAIDSVTASLENQGVETTGLFLLAVPALQVRFLAFRGGNALRLASLHDSAEFGLIAGRLIDGNATLLSLVSAARAVPLSTGP